MPFALQHLTEFDPNAKVLGIYSMATKPCIRLPDRTALGTKPRDNVKLEPCVKSCCIRSVVESAVPIRREASALGLVSAMPSRLGGIAESNLLAGGIEAF